MLPQNLRIRRPEIKTAIEEFITIITQKYPDSINRVILYGSVARGEDTRNSDIDLLIVGNSSDWRFERTLIDDAYDIGLIHGVYISVKYVPKDEYERSQSFSFFKNVHQEGIAIVS